MTGSEFKFLRRVRIHDGECGAVARALHHAAQKVALVRNEQSLISDECIPLRQAGSEKASDSTFNERKQMSTKTSIKRIALVAVSALGFGLLSVVPAKAADGPTILSRSSVSGTIAAVANGAAASGTATLNIKEDSATSWDTDQTIVFGLVTRFGAADQCYFDGNDDGTPAGTVTVDGYSDSLFSVASFAPELTVDETAMTLTVEIEADYTTTLEEESITISGLVVKCSTSAPVGRIYVVVESATTAIETAHMNATWSTAEDLPAIVPDNFRLNVSNSATTSNWPIKALSGQTVVIGGRYMAVDGGASITDATFDFTGNTKGEDMFLKTSHGLVTGDRVFLQSPPAGFTANTAYFVIRTDADGFQLATTSARAFSGTVVEGTADDSAVTVDMSWVDLNPGTSSSTTDTAAFATDLFTSSAAHGFTNGDAIFVTAVTDTAGANGSASNAALLNTTRYVEVVSNLTYRLHSTRDGALTGSSATLYDVLTSNISVFDYNKTYTLAAGVASGSTITAYGADTGLGSAASAVYLGTIGSVSASFRTKVDTTKIVTSVASNITTANGDGQIEISEITTGALGTAAGSTTATTFTVTLTGGQFASAPTVGATGTCTIDATHTYPRSSITITSPLSTCTAITIDGPINATELAIGGNVSVVVTVANSTNPTSFTGALETRNLISYGAATAVATTQASVAASATDAVATTAAVTESVAGAFKAGDYVSICFADGDLFSNDVKNVWATVTTGDLKLQGNATSVLATLSQDTATNEADFGNGAGNTQCAYVRVFSASTTASTITWSAGTATVAEGTTGFRMDSNSAAGAITMAVFAGSSITNGIRYTTFVLGSRTAASNYTIAAASTPDVSAGGAAQVYGDVTIAETTFGKFVAGNITVDLTDSAGNASPVATFAATAGANAPVVTQTNANSEIRWSYVVTDFNTITITVAAASTANAATFKVSNIKINLSDVKSSGVAVNSADTYVTVGGAGIGSASYPVQAAKVKAVATTTTADALLELAKAIGTGNSANAAADAALEAIDAANAATDAANLAAEAADAATVAAEEARDAADAATAAVEALASEVATLVAALKAQITTLANTVAKIAKRVKA